MTGETLGKTLAFLGLYPNQSKDGFLGAILITDIQGVPKEFRATHPVRPTLVQKPLYGEALEPYIGVELCGKPLLRSITNKPDLVVVASNYLLRVRSAGNCPVIYVRRAGEVIEVDSSGGATRTLQRDRMDSPTGRFQPIVYETNLDFAEDREAARSLANEAFKYVDLVEPFTRIQTALGVLAAQPDSKFK